MTEYTFVVYTEASASVTIRAENERAAWEKLDDVKYDLEMTDIHDDRDAILVWKEEA